MNNKINHVFLTRFNLPSGGMENVIRAQEGWLRERVQLFERYCLTSVRSQSDKNFSWIIYFDPQSPQWLRDWIKLVNHDGIFVAIFRTSVDDAALRTDLASAVHGVRGRLLSTNLDNDDGICVDFVARAKEHAGALGSGRQAMYFTRGLIKDSGKLYLRTDKNNAFCSVVESWDAPMSCWADWHNRLGLQMPVSQVGGAPGWLQVVHGKNVSNRVRGRRVSPLGYLEGFPGLLDEVYVPTTSELFRDRSINYAVRGAKELLRGTAKQAAMALLGRDGFDRAKSKFSALTR